MTAEESYWEDCGFQFPAARKLSLHAGRHALFAEGEQELYAKYKERRKAGLQCWLCIMMRKIIRQHYGDEPADKFKASYGWVWRFAHCFDIALRRANNHKHQSVEERLPRILRWHARLRRRLEDAPAARLHGAALRGVRAASRRDRHDLHVGGFDLAHPR